MILPCPEDLKTYQRYPLTITLLVLNVFIFILLFSGQASEKFSSELLNKSGLETTGRIYYQYLKGLPAEELYAKPDWILKAQSENDEHLMAMGAYGLRDAVFLNAAPDIQVHGDEVKIAAWKNSVRDFRQRYSEQILYRFGLSSTERGPLSWITYQFSHSNWMHLLSNVVFLAVMGAAVEALAGSGALLLVYIFGGIVGGLGFIWLDPNGTVPMVGASASISALLAFYCFAEPRRRIQFYYFVSPMPNHYGPIFLPTMLIIPLFLVSDLASLWSNPAGLGGGVAYAAHLGGAFIGFLLGVFYRLKDRVFTSHITQ